MGRLKCQIGNRQLSLAAEFTGEKGGERDQSRFVVLIQIRSLKKAGGPRGIFKQRNCKGGLKKVTPQAKEHSRRLP